MKTFKFPVPAWRLTAGALLVALAAGAAQTAMAQPHGGPGMGGPAMGGPGMMALGGGRQIEHMLDVVKATPEQRAQIKTISDAARPDLRALHTAGRTLHDQMQALFSAPSVDARAAETLRQQQLAQHDQASKRMLQMMVDISRVLSPEQRKTLTEKMAQRRSMMERHRSERDALGSK